MDIEWQDALMRLGAATVSGVAIGINRDLTTSRSACARSRWSHSAPPP